MSQLTLYQPCLKVILLNRGKWQMDSSYNNKLPKSFFNKKAKQIDLLIKNHNVAESLFKYHIYKIFKKTKEYSRYIHNEYEKAIQKGLTEYKNKPDGKDWYWYWAIDDDYMSDYFWDDRKGINVAFWRRREQKNNPLKFVNSMARGCADELPEHLTLLDYQYFLIVCIYDSQRWTTEQKHIYFNQYNDKEIKNRICKRIYELVTNTTDGKAVQEIIQKAVKEIQENVLQ
jgi:hypothetical protein